jgi:hypothetical protein
MNILDEILLRRLGKFKVYPSGWYSVNCPCCTYNGEPTPDTKKRGGFYLNTDGSFIYKCFRCKFKMLWDGKKLSRKNKNFLKYLGMSDDEINRIKFELLKNNRDENKNFKDNERTIDEPNTEKQDELKYSLPEKSENFKKLINNCKNKFFINALNFVKNRGEYLLSEYDFYWSPLEEYRNSVIIPIYYKNKLRGYGLRYINKNKTKYLINKDPLVFFNMDTIYKEKRKYIILVEGFFDAMAINCTGILGNTLNEEKIKLLNSTGKEIIVVPDRDIAGLKMIEIAQREGWYVSFPFAKGIPYIKSNVCFNNWEWEKSIKDISDAVKFHGRLYVLKSIFMSKTKDKIYIDLLKKMIELDNKKHKKVIGN